MSRGPVGHTGRTNRAVGDRKGKKNINNRASSCVPLEDHSNYGEISRYESKLCLLHTTSLNLDQHYSRAAPSRPQPAYRGSVMFSFIRIMCQVENENFNAR